MTPDLPSIGNSEEMQTQLAEKKIELNRFADLVLHELFGEIFSSWSAFSRKESRGALDRKSVV